VLKNNGFYIFLNFLTFLFLSCSSTPSQPIGDGQIKKLDGYKVTTELSGTIGVEVNLEGKTPTCEKVKQLPAFLLTTEDGSEVKAKGECRANDKVLFYIFEGIVPPGNHKIGVDENGDLQTPLRGLVLFLAEENEKKSGPDQAYPGAMALAEGVNQNTLSSAAADLTDWWTIKSEAYTQMSFYFQHDARRNLVSAKIYRLDGTNLVFNKDLPLNKNINLGLEGTYYVKVLARPYTPLTQYSISIKKIEEPAEGGGGGGAGQVAKPIEFPVIETWTIDSIKSAILLKLDDPTKIKEGDVLKVFSGNQFIDTCKVVGVGGSEFECHIAKSLQGKSKISARRSL
jgi:hypothetical protein